MNTDDKMSPCTLVRVPTKCRTAIEVSERAPAGASSIFSGIEREASAVQPAASSLADGCPHCDFRLKKGAATQISSRTPEVQEAIERIRNNEAEHPCAGRRDRAASDGHVGEERQRDEEVGDPHAVPLQDDNLHFTFLRGALDLQGIDVCAAWLAGAAGHAFIIRITPGVCLSDVEESLVDAYKSGESGHTVCSVETTRL